MSIGLPTAGPDWLIVELVEYKQAHYPDDRRRIMAAGMSPEGKIQAQWVEEDKLVAAPFGVSTSSTTAARAESGNPIAGKLVARMKRGVRGKVVHVKEVIAGRTAAEEALVKRKLGGQLPEGLAGED